MKGTLKIGKKKLKLSSNKNSNINNGSSNDEQDGEDRLSSLPETLLTDILSRLPLHSAAATSVLSHRWRHRWTQLNRLHFNCLRFQTIRFSKFTTTVDRIFQQLTSPKIYSFRVHYPYATTEKQIGKWNSYFGSLIPRICGLNPKEIQVILEVPSTRYPLISLPLCIFKTPSLVVLQLTGPFLCEVPKNLIFSFPNLKTLELNLLHMNFDLMGKIIKSCPLLESLSLELIWSEDDEYDLKISTPNLKSLAIYMNGYLEDIKVFIDAPKLEYVLLHGRFAFYHFVNNQGTLLEADLGFCSSSFEGRKDYLSHISVLLREISSVRTIHLRDNIAVFNPSNHVDANVLNTFCNLTRVCLVRVSLDQLDWSVPIPACLLAKLKWMVLDEFVGDEDDLKLIKYFLNETKVLEELCVYSTFYDPTEEEESEKDQIWRETNFCKDLFMLLRPSTCEIKYSGEYIHSSSKTVKNGSMLCRIDQIEKEEPIFDFWIGD
ncbi:hypothetical protein SOVF_179570 [Spinacia oleracea]|uniref:F-box/FBD/LRR-repeat protein At1g78760 n=1 Tax=Spinacia oleracea TaxID=3562 RepID=A0A9R0JMQ0_SPIOL|nr:putative F-box/FBD/LRR-repeat protein At1g78760 [Spinacia oleracea]KNA06597.1 hypothetical protein SOVF_179570 [Spinacia oleracea]